MTAHLTAEQRHAIESSGPNAPVPVFDSETGTTYYLVRSEAIELFQQLLQGADFDVKDAYPLMNVIAGREGWDDPEMDIYDQLDPRQSIPSLR